MKFLTRVIPFLLLLTGSAHSQWVTKSYSLASGWNGVWLAGDASYVTVSELFASNPAVTEIWRWNPNPDGTQFTQTPSEPTTNSDEWTIWKRDGSETGLSRMVGNSAYLFRCSSAVSVPIKQLVQPPLATWLISGGNFLGFPSGTTSAPKMSNYFASYPSANTTVLSTPSKIYKYIGGELSTSNPMQVAPGSETMDPNKAYWFNVATIGNFTAPVEYEVASSAGLAFGRTVSTTSVGITNRSTSALTLTFTLGASETAPTNQTPIAGAVPLTVRTYVSSSNSYTESDMGTSYTVNVPASGRATVDFGINRSSMTGTPDSFYASILRIRDSANLSDVSLPVSAQPASPAGLWVVNTSVNKVSPTANGGGSSTSQPFPLLFLTHMDSSGTCRLLTQAYVGRLASAGNPVGISTNEGKILGYAESDLKPVRYFACQMPTSITSLTGTGSFTTGGSVSWTIPIAHNEPTNPFVHTYHPDHDNRDPKGGALAAGQESYNINRTCTFTFTDSPPDGRYVAGWGNTVLGGTYEESITGLHRKTLRVGGTFEMRRVSEVATIDLTTP
ncbi:hypothetical protein JIN84_17040 [Luteolibacter yonseiensis]|uniref:Uncharacterized protein n=1 Tax=Luteolibacter yonseiensis TaxID=1144680 RepID=A0A934VD93_9BACT|nr:hypothetical protein [Luteolibacter yonseiensis]MBK1817329.1 hypothetical protein [Luteolibacter yonseiensis]